MQQLLLTLRFYATGSFYITVGDFGGLHNSTLCKIVKRVTEAISSMRPMFILLPKNREEILSVQEGFYKIARFPRVIAALDCTHVKIISPGLVTLYLTVGKICNSNKCRICSNFILFQVAILRRILGTGKAFFL